MLQAHSRPTLCRIHAAHAPDPIPLLVQATGTRLSYSAAAPSPGPALLPTSPPAALASAWPDVRSPREVGGVAAEAVAPDAGASVLPAPQPAPARTPAPALAPAAANAPAPALAAQQPAVLAAAEALLPDPRPAPATTPAPAPAPGAAAAPAPAPAAAQPAWLAAAEAAADAERLSAPAPAQGAAAVQPLAALVNDCAAYSASTQGALLLNCRIQARRPALARM